MQRQHDDVQWLEQAISNHEQSLLRFCFLILNDVMLAEDAVQETFIKAYKAHARFRGECSEKTWLTRIAVNTCRSLRRTAWFRHTERGVPLDSLPEPSVPFEDRDDSLVSAVMRLPQKYREVILLHYYRDLSMQEVALALGIAKPTAYRRMKAATALLRDELKEWYDE